jgi:hypothetical protein
LRGSQEYIYRCTPTIIKTANIRTSIATIPNTKPKATFQDDELQSCIKSDISDVLKFFLYIEGGDEPFQELSTKAIEI